MPQAKNRMPSEVHIHVTRHKLSAVPHSSEAAASEWMEAQFKAKEAQLTEFYKHGTFGSSAQPRRLSSLYVYASMALFLGLFATICLWMVYHPYRLLFIVIAYFGFFFTVKVCQRPAAPT